MSFVEIIVCQPEYLSCVPLHTCPRKEGLASDLHLLAPPRHLDPKSAFSDVLVFCAHPDGLSLHFPSADGYSGQYSKSFRSQITAISQAYLYVRTPFRHTFTNHQLTSCVDCLQPVLIESFNKRTNHHVKSHLSTVCR